MPSMREYQRRLDGLRPGNKIAIQGADFTVGDTKTTIRDVNTDDILWTRLSLVKGRGFMPGATRLSLDVPGIVTTSYPVYLCRYAGTNKKRLSSKVGSPLTWRGTPYLTDNGAVVVFCGAKLTPQRQLGEIIISLPHGPAGRRLYVERSAGRATWRAYEMTPIEPGALRFL